MAETQSPIAALERKVNEHSLICRGCTGEGGCTCGSACTCGVPAARRALERVKAVVADMREAIEYAEELPGRPPDYDIVVHTGKTKSGFERITMRRLEDWKAALVPFGKEGS